MRRPRIFKCAVCDRVFTGRQRLIAGQEVWVPWQHADGGLYCPGQDQPAIITEPQALPVGNNDAGLIAQIEAIPDANWRSLAQFAFDLKRRKVEHREAATRLLDRILEIYDVESAAAGSPKEDGE
jgi:hypothetical protein